jgi:hypothetical protein
VNSIADSEVGLESPQNYYSLVAETLSSTADSLQPFAAGLFAAVASPMTVVSQQASLPAPPAVKETPFAVVVVAAAFAAAAVVAAVAGAVAVVVVVVVVVTAAADSVGDAAANSVGVAAVVATAGNAFAVGHSAENYPLASLVGPL